MAQSKKSPTSRIDTWSPEARAALKAFKGIKIVKRPNRLKSKNSAAIKRAVKEYVRG